MSHLYFGFPVTGPSRFLLKGKQREASVCWSNYLVDKAGVLPSEPVEGQTEDEDRKSHRDYLDRRQRVLEEWGCQLVKGGLEDRPGDDFVALAFPYRESAIIEPIDLAEMQRVSEDPKYREKLRLFCQELGLKYQEPRWYTVTWYAND